MPKVVQRSQTVNPPTKGTLRTYGLTAEEWLLILRRQGEVCAICKRFPQSGKWVTDHEHVAKFRKMPPETRRLYVRGVICHFCNSHVVGRFVTLEKAVNAVAYLTAYSKRRPVDVPNSLVKRKR